MSQDEWRDSNGYNYPSVLGPPTEQDRDFISNARMEADNCMVYCAFCNSWPEVCSRKGLPSCVIDPSNPQKPFKCRKCYIRFTSLARLIKHLNKKRHWGAGKDYVQEETPELGSAEVTKA